VAASIEQGDIAKIVGIGAGTVSEIVKAYGQRNPGFELLRELTVAVKREGSNIIEYASAIRLLRFLSNYGLTEEQMESLIRNSANHCFKKKVHIQRFIENVANAADLSAEFGVDILELPDCIRKKRARFNQKAAITEKRRAQSGNRGNQ
jgi:hypothetical protein